MPRDTAPGAQTVSRRARDPAGPLVATPVAYAAWLGRESLRELGDELLRATILIGPPLAPSFHPIFGRAALELRGPVLCCPHATPFDRPAATL